MILLANDMRIDIYVRILETAEFGKLLSDLGIQDNTAQEAVKLLADKDNDGVITKQEFYEWIKKDQIQNGIQCIQCMQSQIL